MQFTIGNSGYRSIPTALRITFCAIPAAVAIWGAFMMLPWLELMNSVSASADQTAYAIVLGSMVVMAFPLLLLTSMLLSEIWHITGSRQTVEARVVELR